jgi:hypothetical protein
MAQSGHAGQGVPRQLSGAKRTRQLERVAAAFDPKRTSSASNRLAVEAGFSPIKAPLRAATMRVLSEGGGNETALQREQQTG